MSDERRDLAVDRAIDEVARQMTVGEPSSDFRARVVARLDAGDRPPRFWPAAWILSPIAAAAVVAVTIFVARGFQPRDRSPERAALLPSSQSTVARATPLVESVGRPQPSAPSAEAVLEGPALRRSRPPGHAYATTPEIDALAPPRLEVTPLGVEALPTESIAVTQLDAIAPIAVEPLPEIEERPATNDQRP
jgi:hypothetical protein